MRILDLKAKVYRWKRPQDIRNGTMCYGDGVMLLLDVETDQGITGQGWIGGTAAERPLEHFMVYARVLRSSIIGKYVDDHTLISTIEKQQIKTYGVAGPHYQVLGALDCALWDIRGKAAGKPVHAMLSGNSEPKRVRAYIAGGYYVGSDPAGAGIEMLQSELRHNVEQLRAKSVKIKIGSNAVTLAVDTARVRAAREAIGGGIELMVDANCAFDDLDSAVRYAAAFEPFGITWFEEPFRPDAIELHARFAKAQPIPIAAGENISTLPIFEEYLQRGAMKYVNADVAILAGGYSAGIEIGKLCDRHGAILAPHGCQELQIHFVAAFGAGNGRLEIYPPSLDPQRDKIFPDILRIDENGFVAAPMEPGIGRTPNLAALSPHAVDSIA